MGGGQTKHGVIPSSVPQVQRPARPVADVASQVRVCVVRPCEGCMRVCVV